MIAIDSNVIVDILKDGPTVELSSLALRDALAVGPVAVGETVVAEVCSHGDSAIVMKALRSLGLTFLATEERAAVRAGEMLQRYRARGRARTRVIPDFMIGAHALLQCRGLITYDSGFHRDYFKGLKVIVPGEP